MTGKVKRWNRNSGWGFIKGMDGVDYFVHRNDIKGHSLPLNRVVVFDMEFTDKGAVARNVRYT